MSLEIYKIVEVTLQEKSVKINESIISRLYMPDSLYLTQRCQYYY